MLGSNAIVIATIIYLMLSALVLILMLFSMARKRQKRPAQPPDTPTPSLSVEPEKTSGINLLKNAGINLQKVPARKNTTSLDDIQDFIKSKAEILYNGNIYTINSDRYRIGHNKSCNLPLSENGVSGVHCEIDYRDNRFTLSDLDSTNGTYLNGERVASAVELHNGDEIGTGFAVMEFRRRNQRKTNDSGMETPA